MRLSTHHAAWPANLPILTIPSFVLIILCLTGTEITPFHILQLYVFTVMLVYILASFVGYVVWSPVCLELNYRRTLSMGVPLIRLPIDPMNIPFQVIEPHLFKILDFLPSWLIPNYIWYLRRGWFFPDKADTHVRYGPIFAFVISPMLMLLRISSGEGSISRDQSKTTVRQSFQPSLTLFLDLQHLPWLIAFT
jgi:hypothetical protein